jgi:AcrR family transcriptional regulator
MRNVKDLDSRTRLLVAAENVLIANGVAGLSFDAVALEAGLSKGGVLHHFRTKEDLIDALVKRYVERYDQAMNAELTRIGDQSGKVSRAYIAASLEDALRTESNFNEVGARLCAGLSSDPKKLFPVFEQNRRWQSSLESDGIDPMTATIVRLAVEGLWYLEIMGVDRFPDDMRVKIIERLLEMVDQGTGTGTQQGREKPAKRKKAAISARKS